MVNTYFSLRWFLKKCFSTFLPFLIVNTSFSQTFDYPQNNNQNIPFIINSTIQDIYNIYQNNFQNYPNNSVPQFNNTQPLPTWNQVYDNNFYPPVNKQTQPTWNVYDNNSYPPVNQQTQPTWNQVNNNSNPQVNNSVKLYSVGVNSSTMNYYRAQQNGQMWCWAATLQMLFNYYGLNISQEEIVRIQFGDRLPDKGAFSYEICNLLNLRYIDRKTGKAYKVVSTHHQGNEAQLTSTLTDLENQKPVVIAYRATPTMGHCVLLTAAEFYSDNLNNKYIYKYIVRDPSPNTNNSNGRIEWNSSELDALVTSHWHVSIIPVDMDNVTNGCSVNNLTDYYIK